MPRLETQEAVSGGGEPEPSNEVFVSYSHKNRAWIEELGLEKDPLTVANPCRFWIDSQRLLTGDCWTDEVGEVIVRAHAAVLLISKDFARSEPIVKKELPALGARHEKGLRLVCVPVGRLSREEKAAIAAALGIDELDELLAVQPWSQPLPQQPRSLRRSKEELDAFLAGVRQRINEAIDSPDIARLRRVLRRNYQFERRLGSGPAGDVVIVRDTQLDRRAAVKFLRRSELTGMFDESVRRVSSIAEHPSFVSIHGAWLDAEPHYYVEQYVEGCSLRSCLDSASGGLPIEFVHRVLESITEAVSYAYQQSVKNLNIKPQNVLIDRPAEDSQHIMLCLTDYDEDLLAQAHGMDLIGDDAVYFPPESFANTLLQSSRPGKVAQYRLGVVGLEMLVGAAEFEDLRVSRGAPSALGTQRWPSVHELRPDCPDFLASAIDRMIEIEPHRRFESLADALEAISRKDLLVEVARDSYRRIMKFDADKERRFFQSFYETLLRSCPDAKQMFSERGFPDLAAGADNPGTGVDQKRWPDQFLVLKEAILLLLVFTTLEESEEPTILTRIARSHLSVPAGYFPLFGEALVETVVAFDEVNHPGLRSAWEQSVQPGLDYLARFGGR